MVKSKYSEQSTYSVFGHAWGVIEKLDVPMLRACLQEAAVQILMDSRTTPADTCRNVAVHLGTDLATEWRMTKEYLAKKTTKEIHAIADKFGIFSSNRISRISCSISVRRICHLHQRPS
jgi:hypothetical protein